MTFSPELHRFLPLFLFFGNTPLSDHSHWTHKMANWKLCMRACVFGVFLENKGEQKHFYYRIEIAQRIFLVKLNKTFPFRIQYFMYYYSGHIFIYVGISYVCLRMNRKLKWYKTLKLPREREKECV